jgi:hypothetical protein
MIRLNKQAAPDVILTNGPTWTAVWVDHVSNGAQIADADKGRYRHATIKAALVAETHGKCAYCESKVSQVYPGDVEHILPKRARPDLFVNWDNLTFGCSICNTKKGTYYDPDLPLLNPYVDDPGDHLQFLGPFVIHLSGSVRGETTRIHLDLSRIPLVERRMERMEALKQLIDRWANAADPHKQVLLAAIHIELSEEREYAATLRAFARDHAGIGMGD